jgi:HEAT repeat protein
MSKQSIMDRLMADEDARVRANFVEGLWNRPDADSRAVFRRALEDPDHRVVGNAVAGLHRLGEARAVVAHVGKMARRPEPLFRAAAAWVMGQTGEHRYSAILRQMVRDPDPLVRSNALRSLRRINQTEAGATC